MAQKLNFTRFYVTRNCSMELFHVLDRKHIILSLKIFLSLLMHSSTSNIVEAKTSENTRHYMGDWSEGEKSCLQKTLVLHESSTENKGWRRLTWIVNLSDKAQCRSNRLVCIQSS